MPKRITVNIDIPKLEDIAQTGVRRASLFMGLGLNAARREEFNDYELHKIPTSSDQTSLLIDLFPPDLPVDRVSEFKNEFAVWITACGLREILEHYALFLDNIHHNVLLVLQSKNALNGIDPEKRHKQFHHRGITEKLDILDDKFSITPTHSDSIKQLYDVRNCLTHDLGIVTHKRCASHGRIVLTWLALEVFAKGDVSGLERPITDLIGEKTKEETSILTRMVPREKSFSAGSKLLLSQQDLSEICYFFKSYAIPTAIDSFVNFLSEHKIPLK